MQNETDQPAGVALTEGLGPTATGRVDAGVMDLALRFDESASWLLHGAAYPKGRGVGAGEFLQAATMLRQQHYEIERLRAVLAAIDRRSVNTIRTKSRDVGDWIEDMGFVGKLAREALGPNDRTQPAPTAAQEHEYEQF